MINIALPEQAMASKAIMFIWLLRKWIIVALCQILVVIYFQFSDFCKPSSLRFESQRELTLNESKISHKRLSRGKLFVSALQTHQICVNICNDYRNFALKNFAAKECKPMIDKYASWRPKQSFTHAQEGATSVRMQITTKLFLLLTITINACNNNYCYFIGRDFNGDIIAFDCDDHRGILYGLHS